MTSSLSSTVRSTHRQRLDPEAGDRSRPRSAHGTVVSMRVPAQRRERTELVELMALVAQGDQSAFAALYDATSATVFGIVRRILLDVAQAEEVTQEVYVDAWRYATRFDAKLGSPASWLNTIAHRKAVDRVRSVERSTQRDQRHFEAESRRYEPDVSEVVVARDDSRRVREAMQRLPEAQRTALELAYFKGCSQREVAELLDVPLGTIKTRIRDAMRRLRDYLGEEAPT
jgi:RNA polymerase sigma-70 factor (ECF subfamily)